MPHAHDASPGMSPTSVCKRISPKVSAPRPSVARLAPPASTVRSTSSSRLSGTRASAAIATKTARGKLIKKTYRHEACCASHPPSSGPSAAVIAAKPDQVPMARPRSASGKLALIKAKLPGVASAPPTPWMQRAISSSPIEPAAAQPADAQANSAIPMTKIRRRPKMSPSDPPMRINADRKSEYPSTTHCNSAAEA